MAGPAASPTRLRAALPLLVAAVLLAALLQPGSRTDAIGPSEQAIETPRLDPVASGFDDPVFVTHAGDDRLFVVEQGGLIKVVIGGQVSTFLDISSEVGDDGFEQGLLGLAFDPDYVTNRRFYVMYTANNAPNGDNTIARVLRMPGDPNRADPATLTPMVEIPDFASNHNGGIIAFRGPFLYAGTGDGGGGGDPQGNGQSLSTKLGKILRLDVNNPPTWVPASNPFVGQSGREPLIWAFGLRNPWRFSFDRQTGDLYIGDVGQQDWEEINFELAASSGARNFGWNRMEGDHCHPPGSTCDPSLYTRPIAEIENGNGNCAVTGGYVYRAPSIPSLVGRYVFGDFCSGRIWSLVAGGSTGTPALLLDTSLAISSFGEDRHGELYVVDRDGGVIYRLSGSGSVPVWPALNAPSGSSPDTTPTYTWNAVPGATDYELVVRGRTGTAVSRTDAASSVCSGATCAVTPTTVLSGGTYAWAVQAKNANGPGLWSAPKFFWVGTSPPGQATLGGPSGTITDATPTYTWGAAANAAWYRLVVVNASGGVVLDRWSPDLFVCNATGCGVTQPTPLPAGGYGWVVRTWNPAGFGAWSAAGTFTVSATAAPSRATPASAGPEPELDPALGPPRDGPPPQIVPGGTSPVVTSSPTPR